MHENKGICNLKRLKHALFLLFFVCQLVAWCSTSLTLSDFFYPNSQKDVENQTGNPFGEQLLLIRSEVDGGGSYDKKNFRPTSIRGLNKVVSSCTSFSLCTTIIMQ